MEEVLLFCLAICFCIAMIISVVKEVKAERRAAPNGKVFIKEFSEKLIDIYRAHSNSDKASFTVDVCYHSFNVTVKKDAELEGLQYSTIPLHKSYCLYINDEPVCRTHILHVDCKDKYYLDFSAKRPYKEVVEIAEEAYQQAKNVRSKYYKEIFNKEATSFYSTETK